MKAVSTLRRLGFLCLLAAAGCGGEEAIGPNDALAPLTGDWRADRFVVTNKANPSQAPELIRDLGAQFTLNIQPSGQYTALLVYQATPITEIGILEVSQGEIVFHISYPATETTRSRYILSGSHLTLDGDTEFDFNADGIGDAATAHIELTQQ